uniref:Cytochrome c-type protein NapC n=1 Tax=Candidatus Kentrum eta TaxID=2126337 RepID=A0A450U7P1_9GAMM|nr:MAG: cytochrome c-type protein NapC [Candidatus Kentron sp. H]VFJ89552.1 MAG: cytochrome c-type protein NapC [Candidatus Kentron sp. H]VFJ96245.1 MAG: cytochrome c-type protein NapC [Candidatus Kentron sp. H]
MLIYFVTMKLFRSRFSTNDASSWSTIRLLHTDSDYRYVQTCDIRAGIVASGYEHDNNNYRTIKIMRKRAAIAIFTIVIGVLIGLGAVAGLDTFLKYTSTLEFCSTTCHEMETVATEYLGSTHYKNNAGSRATCADCHVPRPLGAKLWHNMMGVREIYHTVMGTMDTRSKFEARRGQLAENEWRRLKETDSRECRACHSLDAMTITSQRDDARYWHSKAVEDGSTCMECHKGVVHQLPRPKKLGG